MSDKQVLKVGDKVICIDNSNCLFITKDKIYEILRIDDEFFNVEADDGENGLYSKERFGLCVLPPITLMQQSTKILTLPTDSNERKNIPLLSGCLKYFPAALAGVANISKLGNDKHNPGEPLHHARGKSMDHGDCILRHLTDVEDLKAAKSRGDTTITNEAILLEAGQLAWRTLAYVQMLHEELGAPLAPGAKDE